MKEVLPQQRNATMALMDNATQQQPARSSMCPTTQAAAAVKPKASRRASSSSSSSSSSDGRDKSLKGRNLLRQDQDTGMNAAAAAAVSAAKAKAKAASSSSSSISTLSKNLASMSMPSTSAGDGNGRNTRTRPGSQAATSTDRSSSPLPTITPSTTRNSNQQRTATVRARRRPRRSVGFHARTKVYLVPTLDDWTEDEILKSYRTDEDEAITQEEIVSTIRIMRRNSGRTSDDDENHRHLTARGLEHLGTSEAMANRKLRKSRQLNSVLDEQDRQWDNPHLEDHQRIADIANQTSAECSARALASAAEDATYVRRLIRRESAESSQDDGAFAVPGSLASIATSNPDTSRRSLRSTASAGSSSSSFRGRSASGDSADGQQRGFRTRASRSRSQSADSSSSRRSDGSRRSSSSRTGP